MYIEETRLKNNDARVAFYIPVDKWEQIKGTECWKEVSRRISVAQNEAEFESKLCGFEEKVPYTVSYSDIPLMQNAIERIDNLHKRLLVSMMLPTLSLVMSIIALLANI